jgi:type IV secretion system protein VirB9
MIRKFLLLGIASAFCFAAGAAEVPQVNGADHRVRTVAYDPTQVVVITGFFGYATGITFAKDETVKVPAAGYANAWDITIHGNFITVKPRDANPQTNLIIVTDKRVYNFDLRVKPLTNANAARYNEDKDQIFHLQFRYPDEEKRIALEQARQDEFVKRVADIRLAEERKLSDMRLAEAKAKSDAAIAQTLPATVGTATVEKRRRTEYMYEGETAIAPFEMWDDGTFTYLRFYAQIDLPSAFIINEDGSESTANRHFEKDVMVIERVARKFVLRKGTSVVCIYNENPLELTPKLDSGATDNGAKRLIK